MGRNPQSEAIVIETLFEDDLGITGDDGCELLEATETHFGVSLASPEEGYRCTFDLAPHEFLFHSEGFGLDLWMALPVMAGKTKIAGIKIHDTRMMRLMEALLHGGTQLNGCRSADIHQPILGTFGLASDSYTLTQLRYDLRKMKAHGLIERIGRGYRYHLTDKGTKAALMFILFHKRVCGPLANSLLHHRPDEKLKRASTVETAYHKADRAIQQVLELLAA